MVSDGMGNRVFAGFADENRHMVKSQLVPLSKATIAAQQSAAKWHQIPDTNGSATHEVAFLCYLPPLGYSVYTLTPQKPSILGSSSPDQASSISLAGPWTDQELKAFPMGQLAPSDEEIRLDGGMRAVVSRDTGHVQASCSKLHKLVQAGRNVRLVCTGACALTSENPCQS